MAFSKPKQHKRKGRVIAAIDDDSAEENISDIDKGDSDSEKGNDVVEETTTGGGLADVFARILTKQTGNKTPILAKGKTDREIRKRKLERHTDAKDTEVESVDKVVSFSATKKSKDDENEDTNESQQDRRLLEAKREWERMCHVKPDITKKDYERQLQRTATMGVVQLFNAVRKQQQVVEEKLEEAGKSTSRQEKVLKSMTKGQFLDMLNAKGKSKQSIAEKEEEGAEKWSVLRDDFMMGANMKDWDKEDNDEDGGDDNNDEQYNSDSSG